MLQELNNKFHANAFSQHKYDVKSLGWGSKESQEIRFRIIRELGIFSGDTVLDVGCGYGDLYDYLKKNNLDVEYTGIDINPVFIKKAKEMRKADPLTFILGDLSCVSKDFDWVVASGIFSFDCPEWETEVCETLKEAFSISRKGISANILSAYSSFHKNGFKYVKPEDVLPRLVSEISPKFVVRHDYRENDFTVYFYK